MKSSNRLQCVRLLLAQICRCWSGRACRLCPDISDVDLFRYREGIIYLNAEVSDGAFNLGVAEQELHGPQIASAATYRPFDGTMRRLLMSAKRKSSSNLSERSGL